MSDFNHADQAESRIYNQYHDRGKFVDWMRIHGTLCNEMEQAYCDIAESYDIDSAGTEELNVIGRIVGIGRQFESLVDFAAFNFGDTGTGVQFGGAFQFRATAGITGSEVNNDIYRKLIRAKIAKNNSDATLDSIILAMGFIITSTTATIIDHEDMSFTISFAGDLTATEIFILQTYDLVPRPQGVKLRGFIIQSSVASFGGPYQFGGGQAQFNFLLGG